MSFDINNIRLFRINSKTHLTNHLHYQFRTDKGQKWTNEYTDRNMLILNNETYPIGKTLEKRMALEREVRVFLESIEADYSNLYMCRIEYLDNDVYHFDAKLLEEVMFIMQELDNELEEDNMTVLYGVTHEDQIEEYMHFHLLILKTV